MRLLAALAVCTLLAAGLPGCLDDDDGEGGQSSSSTSTTSRTTTSSSSSSSSTSRSSTSTTTSSSSSTSAAPAPNRAPTGSVTALANGTAVAFNLTGSDLDGDALSWSLDFGDGNRTNGTALPASVNHTYGEGGNFSVAYTLTDGESPAAYNLTLNLTANPPLTQSSTGGYAAGLPPSCSGTFAPEGEGVYFVSFDVVPGTIGKPYKATYRFNEHIAYMTIVFYQGEVMVAGGTPFPPQPDPMARSFSGTVPVADRVALGSCGGADVVVTYVAG